jgi:putative transposase
MITAINDATGHGVRRVCEVLQVPRSSYYHAAEPTQRHLEDAELAKLISTIFHHHHGRYGYRRIWETTQERGPHLRSLPCSSAHAGAQTDRHPTQVLHPEDQ